MTWLLMAVLAVAVLAPLAFTLLRPPRLRGRRESDLALHRAQLAELVRERDAGRLTEAAYRAGELEVQRRLLAAPEEAAPARGPRWPVVAALVAVPALALGLYLPRGVPEMPAAPLAARQEDAARNDALLVQLRTQLAALPPGSEAAFAGWVLLADAERARGRPDAAAEAYGRALALRFVPEVAAQRAQVLLEAGQPEAASAFLIEALPRAPDNIGLRFLAGLAEARMGRPENARTAWRALLAEAPADAPWRGMVERRMDQLP